MNEEIHATFWAHLEDLKSTLTSIVFVWIAGFCLALYFSADILNFLSLPLQTAALSRNELRTDRIVNNTATPQTYKLALGEIAISNIQAQLIAPHEYLLPPQSEIVIERTLRAHTLALLSPLEGINAIFTISFWTGIVGTAPLWLFLALRFVAPALHAAEKALLIPFLLFSILFLSAGFAFAYLITIPLANTYLLAFNYTMGTNMWSLASYLDYTLILVLSTGLAFELGLALFYLVHFNIFSAKQLIAKRRHMIVIAFILGAILTPPDVLTQFLLAIPLIILYELTILYAKYKNKRKKSNSNEILNHKRAI